MVIRKVTEDDIPAICNIYNYYIENTTHSLELDPINYDNLLYRVEKYLHSHTWIVAEQDKELLGYAYASPFNTRPGYRHTAESTIYLHPNSTHNGIGTSLYMHLLDYLRTKKRKSVIAGISLPNKASVRFHKKFGFEKVAHYHKVGYKFNKWVDVAYYQLFL